MLIGRTPFLRDFRPSMRRDLFLSQALEVGPMSPHRRTKEFSPGTRSAPPCRMSVPLLPSSTSRDNRTETAILRQVISLVRPSTRLILFIASSALRFGGGGSFCSAASGSRGLPWLSPDSLRLRHCPPQRFVI